MMVTLVSRGRRPLYRRLPLLEAVAAIHEDALPLLDARVDQIPIYAVRAVFQLNYPLALGVAVLGTLMMAASRTTIYWAFVRTDERYLWLPRSLDPATRTDEEIELLGDGYRATEVFFVWGTRLDQARGGRW